MRDEEINSRFERADKDAKHYTDMKIRAVKKLLAPFIWMVQNPKKAIIGFILFVMVCIGIASSINLKKMILDRFNIELQDS